jgi:hypothetical protein
MRITIEHKEETKGIVFKQPVYAVRYAIQFSDEELAIIKHRNLNDHAVFHYDHGLGDDMPTGVPVGLFRDGRQLVRRFDNLVDAKAFEADLKTKHLPALKAVLDASRESGGSTTFEL